MEQLIEKGVRLLQTLVRIVAACLLLAVFVLGMGWLYLLLSTQYNCPYMHGSKGCDAWLVVWASGLFGVPLLLGAIVILIYAVVEAVGFWRYRRANRE
jgi:hypothetical protein